LVSTLKVTKKNNIISDQTRTQVNVLAAFLLNTPRDRCWWSHWQSGTPCGHQTSHISLWGHSKKGRWTCYTYHWSQLQLVENGNCFGSHSIFGILRPQSLLLLSLPIWHCFCSGPKQKCPQLLHPMLGLGLCTRVSAQSQSIRLPVSYKSSWQAPR